MHLRGWGAHMGRGAVYGIYIANCVALSMKQQCICYVAVAEKYQLTLYVYYFSRNILRQTYRRRKNEGNWLSIHDVTVMGGTCCGYRTTSLVRGTCHHQRFRMSTVATFLFSAPLTLAACSQPADQQNPM